MTLTPHGFEEGIPGDATDYMGGAVIAVLKSVRPAIPCALALLFMGCAAYQAKPLPVQSDLATALRPAPGLGVGAAGEGSLTVRDVAALALLTSPELKAARAKAGVTQAQLFSDALLPDPQIAASLDHPTDSMKGLVNGYTLGISLDLQPFLMQAQSSRSGSALQRQARLELQWQEWQTVEQAKNLAVQFALARRRIEALTPARQFFLPQAEAARRAYAARDLAADEAGVFIAAASDVQAQMAAAQSSELQAKDALHAMLGLAPDVELRLADPGLPEPPGQAQANPAPVALMRKRPDLAALQAGYESQDALVHKAVLQQFPAIAIGFNSAEDTSAVHSVGPSVTLSLPLFNRGRGAVAIANATRDQLWAEYQARLNRAVLDAWRLSQQAELDRARIAALDAEIPPLRDAVFAGKAAFDRGDLSPQVYSALRTAWLGRELERLDTVQSLWTSALALESTTGRQRDTFGEREAHE